MSTSRRVKLSDQTADRLYSMIVDEHRYAAGAKLPNENELSIELGVSRTTLREAISALVSRGVLQIRRGRGTYVSQDLILEGVSLSEISSIHSVVRARDLFEMRLIFEPATISLACQRASDEELEQIRLMAKHVEEVAAQGGDWPTADQEFHQAIIRASHNEYMRRLYPIINGAVHELMDLTNSRQEMQEIALSDNRTVLEFLLKRDAFGAGEAMGIHMRHLINTFQD